MNGCWSFLLGPLLRKTFSSKSCFSGNQILFVVADEACVRYLKYLFGLPTVVQILHRLFILTALLKTMEVLELYFLGDLKHRHMKDQAAKKCLGLKCLNHILEDTCECKTNTFILNFSAGISELESEFLRHLKTCFSLWAGTPQCW